MAGLVDFVGQGLHIAVMLRTNGRAPRQGVLAATHLHRVRLPLETSGRRHERGRKARLPRKAARNIERVARVAGVANSRTESVPGRQKQDTKQDVEDKVLFFVAAAEAPHNALPPAFLSVFALHNALPPAPSFCFCFLYVYLYIDRSP